MAVFQQRKTSAFLQSYIAGLPKKGRGEIGQMARHLGVSSTLMSHVVTGKKTLTLEQAQSLCEYLGLLGLEQDYFMHLVLHERAGSELLRNRWRLKLDDLRAQSLKLANRVQPQKSLGELERSVFYSSPLYSAIHLYASVGANGKSAAEIAERFELSRQRVSEIISFLVENGMIVESNGRYQMGSQSTHVERGSPHLQRHHANWRIRAIQQSENLSNEELMYTAQVSLSKRDFSLLREEMTDFIKKFLARVHDSPAEEIAAFNLDFMWIKK